MMLGKCGSEAAPHGTPPRSEGISVDWFDRKTRKHDVESPLETSILDPLDRKRNFAAPHRSVSTMHALRSKFESDRLNKARPDPRPRRRQGQLQPAEPCRSESQPGCYSLDLGILPAQQYGTPFIQHCIALDRQARGPLHVGL